MSVFGITFTDRPAGNVLDPTHIAIGHISSVEKESLALLEKLRRLPSSRGMTSTTTTSIYHPSSSSSSSSSSSTSLSSSSSSFTFGFASSLFSVSLGSWWTATPYARWPTPLRLLRVWQATCLPLAYEEKPHRPRSSTENRTTPKKPSTSDRKEWCEWSHAITYDDQGEDEDEGGGEGLMPLHDFAMNGGTVPPRIGVVRASAKEAALHSLLSLAFLQAGGEMPGKTDSSSSFSSSSSSAAARAIVHRRGWPYFLASTAAVVLANQLWMSFLSPSSLTDRFESMFVMHRPSVLDHYLAQPQRHRISPVPPPTTAFSSSCFSSSFGLLDPSEKSFPAPHSRTPSRLRRMGEAEAEADAKGSHQSSSVDPAIAAKREREWEEWFVEAARTVHRVVPTLWVRPSITAACCHLLPSEDDAEEEEEVYDRIENECASIEHSNASGDREKKNGTGEEEGEALEQLTREKKDLEETVENLRRGEQHRRATDKEEALEKEALHVQLQVLLRQREEMKKEVEQVRHKMIHSIRQAGENHAAHLRVVEERHRTALEDQRQVNRTHEMEILKLRAQLARMDPNASAIGGGMCGNPSATSAGGSGSPRRGGMSSTSALLEAQTLQAQDIEIKRLYADLGHAQRQRDEALDRWHELSERMDEKERGWMDDHRREEQSLQQRLHEVRSQLDRKDGECTRLQRVVSEYKDRQRQLEDGQSELRQARDQLQEELAEQKKMLTEKDHILRHVQEDQDRYHGQEVERQARLEQRVEAVLEELRQSRNKSIADLQNVERERDTMRTQLQEGKKQLVAVQQMVAQRDREKEVMEIQMSKLLEGLSKHKNELLFTDNRLLELQRGKEEVERQQRINVLAMEHLKLENARLQQQLRRPL